MKKTLYRTYRRIKWMLRRHKLFIKTLLGFGTVKGPYLNTICYVSQKTGIECHDYPEHKGGTGQAWYFMMYQCPYCKQHFFI